jgi:nicotinamidase-related amidase
MATKHVLIVVDLQKGFITGASEHLIKPVQAIQQDFKHVIFGKFINPDSSPFRRILDYHKLAPGSEDTELAVVPRRDALIIEHSSYSCLTQQLQEYLEDLDATEAYICGIATEACVFKTVIDLFEANICPRIIRDLCASDQDVYYHDAGLALLTKLVGRDCLIERRTLAA